MKIQINQAYSFSQQGKREYQEDFRYPDTEQASEDQRFFVVCDGVGGSEKGEVASKTVCEAIGRSMAGFGYDQDFTSENFNKVLDDAYDALDQVAGKEKCDMGTTMTFICFHAGGCTMAHIGDSRIYQIRPSEGIIYRSDDHSLVNSMVHNGMITPEEGLTHSQRNVITRFMEPVETDQNRCMATVMRTTDIKSGDYFLLCTDGVLHCISDDQLLEILMGDESDEKKMHLMADMSKESEDNNTAWLIAVAEVVADKDSVSEEQRDGNEVQPFTKRMKTKTRHLEEIESIQPKNENFKSWFNNLFKLKH